MGVRLVAPPQNPNKVEIWQFDEEGDNEDTSKIRVLPGCCPGKFVEIEAEKYHVCSCGSTRVPLGWWESHFYLSAATEDIFAEWLELWTGFPEENIEVSIEWQS